MRLQAASLGALHILADAPHLGGIHRVPRQRPIFQQIGQMLPVERRIDHLREPRPHLGLVAVANGFQQQLA